MPKRFTLIYWFRRKEVSKKTQKEINSPCLCGKPSNLCWSRWVVRTNNGQCVAQEVMSVASLIHVQFGTVHLNTKIASIEIECSNQTNIGLGR
ncbi:hypothetical protein FRX31_025679 [Thalictrum thalictroides]|uniref:Uncharacterized protein n=1 Tax=Thalictrum thalictroides TaxID=46969 RepID=A0A7J6VII2_THATH|nr:hypothetical protein FRX31_025679 [Thalictrum thalictroides]